jgi:glycerophosphoryl diester phosphodiesterase
MPLIFSVADADNYMLVDLEQRRTRIVISRATEKHSNFLKYFFLGSSPLCHIASRYALTTRATCSTTARTAWTTEQLKAYHNAGKTVVVNFTANQHEMDLAGMKAAVAKGADGIFVDYPRLGADAVRRPVELRLSALAVQADAGESSYRANAILKLSRYRGFPLEAEFARWLLDPYDHVSRAAAVALATARPRTDPALFREALKSENSDARANAAWGLGVLGAPVTTLLPLLQDRDPQVLQETLLAMARMPGEVSAQTLRPMLANQYPSIRGAAALALARHQPAVALKTIPVQLHLEVQTTVRLNDDYVRRGRPQLTQTEIDEVTRLFRCEMKMVQAISMLKDAEAIQILDEQALRPSVDFTQMLDQITAFQLWDRIGADAQPAVEALGTSDPQVADRAEWMLVQGGAAVLQPLLDVNFTVVVDENEGAEVRWESLIPLTSQSHPGDPL